MSNTITTLDFGIVEVKKDKTYTKDFVTLVEMTDGSWYELYTNWNGKIIAIKLED